MSEAATSDAATTGAATTGAATTGAATTDAATTGAATTGAATTGAATTGAATSGAATSGLLAMLHTRRAASVPGTTEADGTRRQSAPDPAWLERLRADATARVREQGLPGKKHERWRFTSVREVVETPFEHSPAAFAERVPSAELVDVVHAGADEREDETARRAAARLAGGDELSVVLVDGRPVAVAWPSNAASEAAGIVSFDAISEGGVRLSRLSDALRERPEVLEPVLGSVAPSEPFASLNAAMFDDGLLVELVDDAALDRPLHLVHVAVPGTTPRATYPRVMVLVGPRGRGTLIETFVSEPALRRDAQDEPTASEDERESAAHLTNGVTELLLAEGAELDHTRLLLGDAQSVHLAHLAARLERASRYASRIITLGGRLSRLELDIRLAGQGAEALLEGAYHVQGTEHVDHQLRVEHGEPEGSSATRYRGLLDGRGHAVLNAEGLVRREARGASVQQESRSLLLSDDAVIDAKPHLEIETDDVRASHGATIGSVDEEQLFYLRSRGIPEAEARDLLTFSFVREIIDRIPHAPTARRAADAILARLPSGARMRELGS
jgi:Fe-S cluster assembly protein SufD